jgi:hypothetical protein
MGSRWNFGLNGASSSWASSKIAEAKIHSSSGWDKRCFWERKEAWQGKGTTSAF